MAALFMLAVVSSDGSAAVVVLSNRTAAEVHFILAGETQEQSYSLAADEVRTLRIPSAADFWFTNDPESAYRLRGGCAYMFLRNGRDRRLELHRLGLADEQSWLDENQTGAEPPTAAATFADERTIMNDRGAPLQIVIAFDAFEPADVEDWERRLRALLDKASQVTSLQCGVALEAVDFQRWRSDRMVSRFDDAWHALVAAVPAVPGRLVVGFTTRPFADLPCSGFPNTVGPLTSHLLVLADSKPNPQRERMDGLLHALGHYLGAVHSPESDSIMRVAFGRPATDTRTSLRFDPINALAMALVGEDLASRTSQNLAALNPTVRRRLVSVYATLAEAAPRDPFAPRFLRLLSVAPVEPPSRRLANGFHTQPHASGTSTKNVEEQAAQPTADVAREHRPSTGHPQQPDPAEMGIRAEARSAPGHQPGLEDDSVEFGEEGDLAPDPLTLPKALALAMILVAIPLGLLAWRLRVGNRAPGQTDDRETFTPPWQTMQSVDRVTWLLYLVGVAGAAMLSAVSMLPGQGGGLKAAALLIAGGMAAMIVAPLYPVIGPLVYLVLSYAIQRDDPAAVRIDNSGVLAYLALLAPAALSVRFLRERRRPRPPQGSTTWVLLAMMAWIGLTAAGAVLSGLPVSSNLVHRTSRVAQILILFLVTLYADAGLAELRLTALVLALALFARVHVFRADVMLEQNLAMLAAIVCPLLFVSAQTGPSRLAKAGFYLMLAYFVVLIVYIQNRAAMVALPAAAAVLLFSSRHRGRAILIAAPLALALAVWLPSSGYLNRFGEIYQEGEFRDSASMRLRIWAAGWHMACDHAALGVGPGNFERFVQKYDPELPPVGPHNSFVQLAAETGLASVAIYVALILAASLQLASTVGQYRNDWRGTAAGAILASLAAHVVTGCFLENPSLAVTYVALGMGLALATAPVTRVYRQRLYLPLPDFLAGPLAEFVVRCPRIVSGMPVGRWSASSGRQAAAGITRAAMAAGPQDSTWWLRLMLFVDVLVTVAGSLAPFSFRPLGVRDAVALFCQKMSQGIEFGDRSDWMANALLFVPFGFLALAASYRRRQGTRWVAASVVIVVSLLFSSALELTQVWFPSRTVNPNDVVAETLGAAMGVMAFVLFGDRLVALTPSIFAGRNPLRTSEKLLLSYAVAVVIYAAWPFDVTINPVDFASKLREGRIDFADWARPGAFVNFATSAVLMAPIGALLATVGTRREQSVRSFSELVASGFVWLIVIEFCRLLIYSQSAGLVHLAGGAAGILLGGIAQRLFSGLR